MGKRIKPTASYKGRIAQWTFWESIWPYLLAGMAAWTLDVMSGFGGQLMGPFAIVVALLFAIPVWRLALRRAHDRNHSGLYVILLSALPIIGAGWLLLELGFLPGTRGRNRFGPEPASTLSA